MVCGLAARALHGLHKAKRKPPAGLGWPLRIVMKLKVNDGMNDG